MSSGSSYTHISSGPDLLASASDAEQPLSGRTVLAAAFVTLCISASAAHVYMFSRSGFLPHSHGRFEPAVVATATVAVIVTALPYIVMAWTIYGALLLHESTRINVSFKKVLVAIGLGQPPLVLWNIVSVALVAMHAQDIDLHSRSASTGVALENLESRLDALQLILPGFWVVALVLTATDLSKSLHAPWRTCVALVLAPVTTLYLVMLLVNALIAPS